MGRVTHKKFWIVWSPLKGEATIRHDSYDVAEQEAMRLAIKHPNNSFYVLEAQKEWLGTVGLVTYELEQYEEK